MTKGDTMGRSLRRRLARGALLSSLLLTSSCFATNAPAHAAAPGPAASADEVIARFGD